MSVRTARVLSAAYFLLYLLAVVWPGYLPFNRVEPRILGLPLSMAWPTAWLLGGAVVLFLLDRVEAREREDVGSGRRPAGAPEGPGGSRPPSSEEA